MKSRAVFGGLVFGCAASLLAAPRVLLPYRAMLLPPQSPAAFTADKGKFRIMQQGSEVGTEEFDIAPSGTLWVAHGEAVIRVPGSGMTRSTGQLRLAADGSPVHYDWTAQAQKKSSGTVIFDSGTAKSSITLEGKDPVHQDFKFTSPRIAVLDNNLYDQYEILGRLYDWNAKGAQTFPVVIPQDMTPGSITVESLGPKTAGGAQLDALQVRSTDLEIIIYFDAKRRLTRLEVPAAMVVIVRQ
jgi:hypothetical protein